MENADTTCKSIIIINRKNVCVSRVLLCEAQIIIADIHRTGKKIFQELLFGLFYILFVGRLLPFIWAEISSFSSRALHNFHLFLLYFDFLKWKVYFCVWEEREIEKLLHCQQIIKNFIARVSFKNKEKKNREGT